MRLNHIRPPRRSGGFVLIYVAAILIFLTGLVLHNSRDTRAASQVSARLQEQLAARDRLMAAAMLFRARLEYRWSQVAATERRLTLFSDGPLDALDIDGVPVGVAIQDADIRPDANGLETEEWIRLLGVYGVARPDAERLMQDIQTLGDVESIYALAVNPRIPAKLIRGFEDANGDSYPALVDILTLGGGSKRLHVEKSPLPLFVALLNASPDQLARFKEARRTRRVTLADATLIFGSDALKLCYEGSPAKLRAYLRIAGVPLRIEIEISVSQGRLIVSAPRLFSVG